MLQIEDILIDLCGNNFLEPYLRRELEPAREENEGVALAKRLPPPRAAVSIRTDAGSPSDPDFEQACEENCLPVLSLYCPMVIGTGMIGLPRRIASAIYKGFYFNITGNASRVSAIHASDMARAAALAAGTDGTFTVTDGADPTVDELADAISYRLGDKRLLTLKPWLARILLGREFFSQLTSDHLASDSFGFSYPGFRPTPVAQYLRSHVYDEKSL